MTRSGELGGSKLSTLFWVAVLAAVLYVGWSAGPAYVTNFRFKDALEEIARTGPGPNSDSLVRDRLTRSIKELELQDYITAGQCTTSMVEMTRTIDCSYVREVKFLPGFRRTVTFNNMVRQTIY